MSSAQLLTAVIASVIAALASILNLVLSMVSQYRTDLRRTRRETLAPHLVELSEQSYAVVARTAKFLEAGSDAAQGERREKAKQASVALDTARRRSRLFLGSIAESLHALVVLPRLAEHVISSPDRAGHLISLATDLRRSLDQTLRDSYVQGRFPSSREEKALCDAASRVHEFFSESRQWTEGEEN